WACTGVKPSTTSKAAALNKVALRMVLTPWVGRRNDGSRPLLAWKRRNGLSVPPETESPTASVAACSVRGVKSAPCSSSRAPFGDGGLRPTDAEFEDFAEGGFEHDHRPYARALSRHQACRLRHHRSSADR